MEFSFSRPTLVPSGREDWKHRRERRQGTGNEWRAAGTSRHLRAGASRNTRWRRGQNAERWKADPGTSLRKKEAEITPTSCQETRQIRFQRVSLRASDTREM